MNGLLLLLLDELFHIVLVLLLARVVRQVPVFVGDGEDGNLVNGADGAVQDLIVLHGFGSALVEPDVVRLVLKKMSLLGVNGSFFVRQVVRTSRLGGVRAAVRASAFKGYLFHATYSVQYPAKIRKSSDGERYCVC